MVATELELWIGEYEQAIKTAKDNLTALSIIPWVYGVPEEIKNIARGLMEKLQNKK